MRTPVTLILLLLLATLAPAVDDEEPIEVDLGTLTSIDYKEGEPLPEEIQELDEQYVRIDGFMEPNTPEETSIFLLVTDSCGCNGRPKVFHFVEVDLGDEITGSRPDLLTVTGTLSVGERWEDDYVVSLYRLKADSVQ